MNSAPNNYIKNKRVEPRPPPIGSTGAIGWLRQNLFSSIFNGLLTLICIYGLILIIPAGIDWVFLSSQFTDASNSTVSNLSLLETAGLLAKTLGLAGLGLTSG